MLPALFILLVILSLPLTIRFDGFFALKSPLCAPFRVIVSVFSLRVAELWADAFRLIAEKPQKKPKKKKPMLSGLKKAYRLSGLRLTTDIDISVTSIRPDIAAYLSAASAFIPCGITVSLVVRELLPAGVYVSSMFSFTLGRLFVAWVCLMLGRLGRRRVCGG